MRGTNWRRHIVSVCSLLAGAAVVGLVSIPVAVRLMYLPQGVAYYLGGGYLPDYYQYLSWVRSGMDGALLLTTRFDAPPQIPVFIHPFFLMVGWLSRVAGTTPYWGLFAARIGMMVLFIRMLWALVDRVRSDGTGRMLGRIAVVAGTCFWSTDGSGAVAEPIAWSTNFNVIGKFALSPHHLAALSAVIATLLVVSRPRRLRAAVRIPLLVILPVCVVLLNPSMALILFLVLGTDLALWAGGTVWRGRGNPFPAAAADIILPLVSMLPVLVYNQYLFVSVHPWNLMYDLMRKFRPPVTLGDYLLALGPSLPLAAVAMTGRSAWATPLTRRLAVWGFVPVFLFPLVGTVLPLNESRLFQLYQFVPLTVLSALGILRIDGLVRSRMRPGRAGRLPLVPAVAALGLLVYAGIPAAAAVRSSATLSRNEYANYLMYGSVDADRAYRFLDATGGDTVVVAGEFTSQLVAALTPHRVLLGRDDSVRGYLDRRARVFDLVNGKMTPEEIGDFSRTYGVRYLLMGIDTYPFEMLPYGKTGQFREVYRSGSVSVQEVIR